MFYELLVILIENIMFSISQLNTFIGLWIPLILSIIFVVFDLIKNKPINIYIILFFAITLFLNFITARVIVDDHYISLSFSDFSMIALLLYIKIFNTKISYLMPFYFSFFSNLFVDIYAAPNKSHEFLYHIGGAGFQDGLIIYPLVTFIVLFLFNHVRLKSNRQIILY